MRYFILPLIIIAALLSGCTSVNYAAGKAYMEPDIGIGVSG